MFKVTNKTLSIKVGQRHVTLLETPVMGVLNFILTVRALVESQNE